MLRAAFLNLLDALELLLLQLALAVLTAARRRSLRPTASTSGERQ